MANQLKWSMGFRNHASGKYLTQEQFGYALNANATSLKKKQTFYLHTDGDGQVHIKTHLNKFIYGTRDGDVKGDADSPSADTVFTIEPQADGTWALKTAAGFYLHGTGDKLTAFVKDLPADGKWVVHLAMHPQINLYNVMRKRYVHLEGGALKCNEDIAWGFDAMLTFVFFESHADGRYGLMAPNGQYLTATGALSAHANADCEFLLGFHDNQISFRDNKGSYLSAVGGDGLLKTNKQKITKDELFVIEDSQPQFTITSSSGKYVSVRTTVEVKADQADQTDAELFQMEFQGENKVSFKTAKTTYWAINDSGLLEASEKAPSASGVFTIEYHGTQTKFVANNGKYLVVKSNGGIAAAGDGSDAASAFVMILINRPQLVLRGQYGFVGIKGASGRLECNKSHGEIFTVEPNKGAYRIKASTGGYWKVDPDGHVSITSSSPVDFYLEFRPDSKVMVRTEDGAFVEGEQNGGMKGVGSGVNKNTEWEC
jgi:fascin 1/2